MNGKGPGTNDIRQVSSLPTAGSPLSAPSLLMFKAALMFKFKAAWLLVLASSTLFIFSLTCLAEPDYPQPQGMVNDFAGKLSPATKQQLETLLTNFKDLSGGIEVSVVTFLFFKWCDYHRDVHSFRTRR